MTLKQFLNSIRFGENPRIAVFGDDGFSLTIDGDDHSVRFERIPYSFVQYYGNSKINIAFPFNEDDDIVIRIVKFVHPDNLF